MGPMPRGAQPVQISARDKATLKAWWFLPAVSNGACVMVLHGIGDSKAGSSGFAPLFLNRGYAVLAPDSRAHGESGGEFVTYGLLEKYDTVAWAYWMRSQGCRRLYGLGESLGASTLIQAIGITPMFSAIVAECPYSSLRRIGVYRTQHMMPSAISSRFLAAVIVETGMLYARVFDGLDFCAVSPRDSLRASSTPVLLIHGLMDSRTPPDESRLLRAARPEKTTLWLVPNGGHTDASTVAPSEFRTRVLAWFEEH
jgi:uncharacterized protein